jgi:NADH:ubiquinone oxidoreductase subunit E
MKNTEDSITICMGSSCFSRGNNVNAESIERFLVAHNFSGRIHVLGCLCEGHCKGGPNIKINDELIQGVEPEMLFDLLKHKLCKENA